MARPQAPRSVTVLGECVADAFTDPGQSGSDELALRALPGGGPANTAVALARLGTPPAFSGASPRMFSALWAVVDLAEQGVRSSVVRIATIAHSTTDTAGFLPTLIALAKEKGFVGYPGDGANLWNAVHIRDAATLFRLALEKGPAGTYWHAVEDGGIPFRDIAEAIAGRLGLPAVSVPDDALMTPGYFGFLTNIVTQSYPASNLITAGPSAGNPPSPACSPIWTTAIASPPADGRNPDRNEPGNRQVQLSEGH